MKAILKLFKALPIKVKQKAEASKSLLEKTIEKGFIFSPEVVYNCSDKELIRLADVIEEEIGLTPEQMNSSFHKSWKKIKEAGIEQLVFEQIVHYITTYGFEKLGVYNPDSVYIPNEKLEIPHIDIDNINLTVINGYTRAELKDKLLKLLSSGIALEKETINNVVDVALWLEINEQDIGSIRNKEASIILYDNLNIVPANSIEFLRYIIYKSIEKTLIIKSKEVISEIKSKKNVGIIKLFDNYINIHGIEKLSEIFYRFKPIFLAFKTNPGLNKHINKIRRLAVKYHKPMREDYLNEITAKIKKGDPINERMLESELNRVNIFRKIRLANALKFRTKYADAILYKIRNGKSYAKEFHFDNKEAADKVLSIVIDSIAIDIEGKVYGKKIYIPEYMNYALPATEKQFTGNFPSGSSVSLSGDMVFGINWKNVGKDRIDLDLSLMSADMKIGWDAFWRKENSSILFSGDMTDATGENGASELFYIKPIKNVALIVFVNFYNFRSDLEVPFKILVAKKSDNTFGKNYMVDPNDVISIASSTINKKQKMLGIVIVEDGKCMFHFAEAYLGKSITSTNLDYANNARKYLFNYHRNALGLGEILERAGAKIVKDKECDINLSPWDLEKDTIINLLT